MGLMDRDYYREKRPDREDSFLEKLKRNPLAVIVVALLLLLILAYIV